MRPDRNTRVPPPLPAQQLPPAAADPPPDQAPDAKPLEIQVVMVPQERMRCPRCGCMAIMKTISTSGPRRQVRCGRCGGLSCIRSDLGTIRPRRERSP